MAKNFSIGVSLAAAVNTGKGSPIDMAEHCSGASFQITTTGVVTAGAITVLGSIDNNTFIPLTAASVVGSTGAPTLTNGVLTFTAASTALLSLGTNRAAIRFFRVDVSTLMVGGTVSAVIAGL